MNKFRAIVIKPSTTGGSFCVAMDNQIAMELGSDEALGVIATALFSDKRPPYLCSYEQEERREARWLKAPEWADAEQAAQWEKEYRARYDRSMAAARDLISATGIISMVALPRREVS